MSDATAATTGGGGGERKAVLRLVIADGQPMFARSLELVLGSTSDGRIEVVGTATTVDEAIEVLDGSDADLVLVDLDLPLPGGVELVRRLVEDHPDLRVLAMSKADDFEVATLALSAGAEGLVSKASKPEQLLAPLLAVLQGWKVLSAPMLEHLLARADRPAADLLASLSDEERELWRLVAHGLEISAIGDELYVSERTAKRMVADLRVRLGARTRIEMATLAGRSGLLDD